VVNTYISSDWHFGHTNIIHIGKGRPFNSLTEMENKIIENTNKVVRLEDRLILVGDICLGKKQDWEKMLNSITCKNIILVQGNHDTWKSIPKDRFSLVTQQMTMRINGRLVLISHYPYRAKWWKLWLHKSVRRDPRRPVDRGMLLLHGHNHRQTIRCDYHERMLSVGVDAHVYCPVNIEKLVAKFNGGR